MTTIAETNALFTDNHAWGDMTRWNNTALALHGEGGIFRINATKEFAPFWAVIDHTAIHDIERQPALYTNAPEPVLTTTETIETRQVEIKTLIHVDDPLHNKLRQLTVDWFKPRTLNRLNDRLDQLSQQAITIMGAAGGACDFATDISLSYPLQVILEILALPEADYPKMLVLTQQLLGQEDPDLQREVHSAETQAAVLMDFYAYFADLTDSRRAEPTDDLASLIANGTIDGEPLEGLEQLSYYLIVATAGHDTTSSAMAGGLQLLAENPDQLALLQERPDLMANAVEEMIRLTSPVRHFMRTAQADAEILGQPIKRGDWVYLSYKAANIDPEIFEDPLRFDITRPNANRHVAFGYGVHFCLGAQLARMEMRNLFSHLVPKLQSLELDGEPATMKTTFVGGHKHLPVRYELAR